MQSNPGVMFSRRRNMASLVAAVVLAMMVSQASFAGGVPKKTFPRLGGYQIGATPFAGYDDPEYHKAMAKLDVVIIGSEWRSANDTAAAVRSLNPNTVLIKYTSLQSVSSTFQGYSAIKRDKVSSEKGPNQTNAHDWWARDYNGNHVSNWPNNWTLNITKWTQPDANGDHFPEWAAKLDYDWWIKHDQWDGVFEDSVFWKPRGEAANVDWSGGKVSDSARINSEFRLGHQAYWNQMQRLAPGKFIIVNADWYRSQKPSAEYINFPEYDKKVDGGMLELVMWSSDLVGTPRTAWNHILIQYRRSMGYFRDPNLTFFLVKGEPDNYRFFRYSFATCLLDDGYFDYAPIGYEQYGTVEWFDEFDLAGTAGTDWLGRALDAPPASAWVSGVWRRDFEGGVAIVNPRGNGAQTVTIEDGFRRIAGKQENQVNNGQPANRITLQDGDGIILVREGVVKAPIAPKPPVLSAN